MPLNPSWVSLVSLARAATAWPLLTSRSTRFELRLIPKIREHPGQSEKHSGQAELDDPATSKRSRAADSGQIQNWSALAPSLPAAVPIAHQICIESELLMNCTCPSPNSTLAPPG